jgi:GT2 family glycosyltransferase
MNRELSVVIPTFNRMATLPAVLEALGAQTLEPGRFEVLAVDDGSSDDTPQFLRAAQPPFELRVFSQANTGPAGARNRGVRAARGELVVFLGDDTIPEAEFLERHLEAHRRRPSRRISVLGYTTWPRDWRVTPFLHHINEYGMQFGYGLIDDPERVPFNFYYTSNISTPRTALLEAGLFDTSFPHAAWEDIELSYRLSRLGFEIVYCPDAVARHRHRITFSSFRRRQERSGEVAAIFARMHPELSGFLGVEPARAESTRIFPTVALWASLSQRWDVPGGRRALDRVLRLDYLRGLRRGLEAAASEGRGDLSSGQATGPDAPSTPGLRR